MRPLNLLILCVDQQSTKHLGCYGSKVVKTPHIDRLAFGGTRFENTYTPSPICVPARSIMATGRYVHQTECWDNIHPYHGQVESWAHILRNAGHRVVSIGKLHYRNEQDDTGFDEQIIPMHVAKNGGDIKSLLRDPLPGGKERSKLAEQLEPNGSSKTRYDSQVTKLTCQWLKEVGTNQDKPWALFMSQVSPHPPLTSPREFFDLYMDEDIEPIKQAPGSLHPWIQQFRNTRNDDDFFTDETRVLALRNYYGLCSFADHNIGLVLKALEESGQVDNTRIIFTSDHGDNLGARSLWSKCDMYEEVSRVPLILAGPEVPKGKVCATPTSLIDLYPTVLEAVGIDPTVHEVNPHSKSLWHCAVANDDPARVVFAEYHAAASPSASYMIRKGRYKYIYYVGYEPELFDLESDPEELENLATNSKYKEVCSELEAELRKICNPEEQDRRAKVRQQKSVEKHGGRAVVEKMGWLQGTPVPGEEVDAWR